ncbi:MAG: response regulator [Butyrivibrio sp.]|nr:response regulator [Butyrivibrio sp.]
MNKRILLIGESKRFMVNAIETGLSSENFDVEIVEPEVTEIARIEDKPQIIIIYLEEAREEYVEMLVYIKDFIDNSADDILLYLIGNIDEFKKTMKYIPEKFVTSTFPRPLNVKDVAERIRKDMKIQDKVNEKKRILVVDDDGTMLRTIKEWLDFRYSIFIVNSGMNAITFLAKNKVDLILLDYEMPVANGPQVLEMIRSEPATEDIPVIFLTAKGDKQSVMKVVGLKPDGYFLKNIGRTELLENLQNFFESRKKSRL